MLVGLKCIESLFKDAVALNTLDVGYKADPTCVSFSRFEVLIISDGFKGHCLLSWWHVIARLKNPILGGVDVIFLIFSLCPSLIMTVN
jgi:hypothetical protein